MKNEEFLVVYQNEFYLKPYLEKFNEKKNEQLFYLFCFFLPTHLHLSKRHAAQLLRLFLFIQHRIGHGSRIVDFFE
jgi:hypothetical protein